MQAAVVIVEPPEGKVVFWNEEVVRQYGMKEAPIPGEGGFPRYPIYHLDCRKYGPEEYRCAAP
jgi:hypothetical protein